MRWSIIRLIWLRELRDQLRDRRTLFMIVVLPLLLYPVLGYGVLHFALGFRQQPRVIGVVSPPGPGDFPFSSRDATMAKAAGSPSVLAFLAGSEGSNLAAAGGIVHAAQAVLAYPPLIEKGEFRISKAAPDDDPLTALLARHELRIQWLERVEPAAIKNRQVDLILSAPPDFLDQLEQGENVANRQPALEIYGWLDEDHARQAWERVQPLVENWQKELHRVRLARKGLAPTFDQPITTKHVPHGRTAAAPASLFDLLVRVFPFLLVMWSLAGALYPAVDLCAGEKERGTMETLLITPAGREEIVLGKFLTIWVFSAATALLNLVSMGITTMVFSQQFPQGAMPPAALLWCVVLILPLSALFSAVSLAIGAYARSSKEGQYYLMPMFFLIMPLIFLTLAPGVELSPFYSLVPVTGVALLMQKLMTAASLAQVPWLYFIPVLAPIALYSMLALRWAIDQFHREEVLFREAERIDVGLWLKSLFHQKSALPSTGQALFCFGLILGLHWLSLGLGREAPLVVRAGIHLVGFVAAPALVMAVLLTTRPREGLFLHATPWREVALSGLLAILLLPPMALLATTVFAQFPHLTRLLEDGQPLIQELHASFLGTGRSNPIETHILVYALLPALCEELTFRGFILSGLLRRFQPRTAIILCAFLFALFHMNVFQFLPAFFLGMVLGLLTVRSQSLGPAILFHFLHNGVLIAAVHWGRSIDTGWIDMVHGLWPIMIGTCLAAAVVLLWGLYRQPTVETEQVAPQQAEAETLPASSDK